MTIRERYVNAEMFDKFAIFRDNQKMWVVVGPGCLFLGNPFHYWEDALAYALSRV